MPEQNQPTPAEVGAEFLRSQRPRHDPSAAQDAANRVFRAMHGFYGQLWLSRFSTGQQTANGADQGVTDAMRLWGFAIGRYSVDVIRSALARCLTAHPEYPPNLPQFVALCQACQPRAAYRPPEGALPMSQELRSRYARQAREIIERHAQKALDRRAGGSAREPLADGLPALNALCAEAVGLAGGDEASYLLELERRAA